MIDQDWCQYHEALRTKAGEALGGLAPAERERLLVDCWMAHDARWFAAAAETFGLDAANALNQRAVHELGKAEARRLVKLLNLPPLTGREDYLLTQETLTALLGPHLLDYDLVPRGDAAFDIRVRRCFAYENVTRAGIAGRYRCGILPRVTGWLEALGADYTIVPSPGACLKVWEGECAYTITVRPKLPAGT